jgi:class 3 adenylate cyclase
VGLEPSAALVRLAHAIALQKPELDLAPPAPRAAEPVGPESASLAVPLSDTSALDEPVHLTARAGTVTAGTAVVTVLACDLVGSTVLMSRVGDDAADQIRRRVFGAWRAAIEHEGGELVKTIGGVMAVFRPSAVQAVTAAIALHDKAAGVAVPEALCLRVGIATGEAAEEDGDWFGTPVVEAFRLCAHAEPGETLLSAATRQVVGTRSTGSIAARNGT